MLSLFIIDYYNRNSTGLTTYVDQLTNYISEDLNISLHFIFVNADQHKNIHKEQGEYGINYYVPHDIALPEHTTKDENLAIYLSKEIDPNRATILHFNWINHAPFAQFLKAKMICKTVLTKHCIPWRDNITNNYPLFKHINGLLLSKEEIKYVDRSLLHEWVAYNAVDHVICVTKFAAFTLQKLFQYPENQISIVQNGLKIKKHEFKDSKVLRKKYGFSIDDQIILYAGVVNQRKGVFDLVKALDRILEEKPNVRLVIAGNGNHSEILKYANQRWANLTITGSLEKSVLFDFYQMADIGVVPSYIEQCSYTTIEMMHHSLPLLVADVDGLKELVPDEYGLRTPLVLNDNEAHIDVNKLSQNILSILNNKNKANRKARQARIYAEQHLEVSKMGEQTVKIYNRLIEEQETQRTLNCYSNDPLVSVILPCYNGEKYLQECISSILCQSYTKLELIVVNDGSTDNSSTILESYKDDRLIVIHNKQNIGIVDSLNYGIKYAKGKYIARIDTDDIMQQNRLYKQVKYFEESNNDELALVGSHHRVINSKGQLLGLKQYPSSHEEIQQAMLFQNPFSHPSVLMRADIVKKIKYSKKYPHAEDYHLWFKILKKYKAANIPEYLTHYRIHDENTSNKNGREQRESAARLISSELDKLKIDHSVEELKIHIAISQNLGNKIFNNPVRIQLLDEWIEKVLRSQQKQLGFSALTVNTMKDHIKRNYCNIN